MTVLRCASRTGGGIASSLVVTSHVYTDVTLWRVRQHCLIRRVERGMRNARTVWINMKEFSSIQYAIKQENEVILSNVR